VVIGACVVVVAHDAFAEVLSAHAVYTDAEEATERAAGSVAHRLIRTTAVTATRHRAFVVILWAVGV
jgi:hypothetical protein